MGSLIFHIPHSSTFIPNQFRNGIVLSDQELNTELVTMTDLYVDRIFNNEDDTLKFEVSRLVCDVERFENDADEPMAELGMGVVYTKTSTGAKLREYNEDVRNSIIESYYRPHHSKFHSMVAKKLSEYDSCLIVDCHSFNENAEYINKPGSADICIAANSYHTDEAMVYGLEKLFKIFGYSVSINEPFSGSMVPLGFYNKDNRVKSIMIGINRKVYIESDDKINDAGMEKISKACKDAVSFLKGISL